MAAFDQEAIANWLLATPQAPAYPSYDKSAQSAQGKWMTQASKAGNLTTDPDFLISSGLVSPDAFQPMTSYEDVDAPWYRQSQQFSTGSPYQQWVAKSIDSGRTANELYRDVQTMLSNPAAFQAQGLSPDDVSNILSGLPTAMIEQKSGGGSTWVPDPNGAPDLRMAGDEFQRYEQMKLSEPEYTIVDGRPVKATTKESPMAENWYDAGYVSDPTATYDPYMFAPEGVTAETDAASKANYIAKLAENMKMKGRDTKARDARGDATAMYQKYLMASKGMKKDPMPSARGSVDERNEWFDNPNNQPAPAPGAPPPVSPNMNHNINPNNLQLEDIEPYVQASINNPGKLPSAPGGRSSAGRGNAGPTDYATFAGGLVPALAGDVRKKQKIANEAKAADQTAWKARLNAGFAADQARRNAAAREAYVRQLAAMGRSPGRDEVNARNALINGGWG